LRRCWAAPLGWRTLESGDTDGTQLGWRQASGCRGAWDFENYGVGSAPRVGRPKVGRGSGGFILTARGFFDDFSSGCDGWEVSYRTGWLRCFADQPGLAAAGVCRPAQDVIDLLQEQVEAVRGATCAGAVEKACVIGRLAAIARQATETRRPIWPSRLEEVDWRPQIRKTRAKDGVAESANGVERKGTGYFRTGRRIGGRDEYSFRRNALKHWAAAPRHDCGTCSTAKGTPRNWTPSTGPSYRRRRTPDVEARLHRGEDSRRSALAAGLQPTASGLPPTDQEGPMDCRAGSKAARDGISWD